MATIGKLVEYNLDNEKISSYLERVELFMTANGVAEEKQVTVLLSIIGAKTYSLLCNLLSPEGENVSSAFSDAKKPFRTKAIDNCREVHLLPVQSIH